ncbi:hypothetical protein ACFE04_023567 [Oxalis oulophora]
MEIIGAAMTMQVAATRVVVDFRRVNKYGRGRLDCREVRWAKRWDCCWALDCTSSISALRTIKLEEDLVAYSHQQIIDCARHEGAQYDELGCYFSHNRRARQVITGYKRIEENDQEELLKVLAEQPIAAAMMIYPAYKKHKKGIYCGPSNGEKTTVCGMHSVLIVGYNEKSFFILNTYGIEWGDNGDAEVARNVKIFYEEKEEWRPLLTKKKKKKKKKEEGERFFHIVSFRAQVVESLKGEVSVGHGGGGGGGGELLT